jgi:hypothetical protein
MGRVPLSRLDWSALRCAEMTPQLDKMIAAALAPVADALKAAALGPVIWQLVRRDGPFGLYGQLLATVRTSPSIDPLLAEGSKRTIFVPTDALAAAASAGSSSPARDDLPAAKQTGVPAWIESERRYSTELLLLATLILIVLALLAWLDPQTASAPSQPGLLVTPLRYGSVNGGSQQPSRKEPQPESCSPTSGPADGPIRLLPVNDRDLRPSR